MFSFQGTSLSCSSDSLSRPEFEYIIFGRSIARGSFFFPFVLPAELAGGKQSYLCAAPRATHTFFHIESFYPDSPLNKMYK